MLFRRILIANRGEIAVRILRACESLGIPTTAVYSDADRLALHVRMADRAFRLGPPSPAESYLRIDRILDAARETGADAVHPGYGFLSENAEFAAACREAGLAFIGPEPETIRRMGDKLPARREMEAAGVPVIPGAGPIDDAEGALHAAERTGFPVILKAVAGGGGKGMRVVDDAASLPAAFERAASEARNAFGDGRLYLERVVRPARHVEVQVLGDVHGNVLHLGERECSVQRRHQKLVEESPAPNLAPELRHRMLDAAVRGSEALGYRGAGTMEFLVGPDGEFFFLEMNTRLQVEHPVTEMVTGIDLVKEQILVASGAPLSRSQEEIRFRGHAIEARICSEDPDRNFLPASGRVDNLHLPGGPHVRYDSSLYPGMTSTLDYDSLLAKGIAWGNSRETAIARLRASLREIRIGGLRTTIPFLLRVLESPRFREGRVDTGIVDAILGTQPPPLAEETARAASVAAAILVELRRRGHRIRPAVESGRNGSRWRTAARAEQVRSGREGS